MRVRFWGARGSIPVSGRRYDKYGGNTACVEIRARDGSVIIVDAGTGIRELGNLLLTEEPGVINMLLTHAHWDHILGFPFFLPLYSSKTRLEVHGCPAAIRSVQQILEDTMSPPNFPVDLSEVSAQVNFNGECPSDFHIGGIAIETIALNHPNGGFGYKFTEDGASFVFLTANEIGHAHTGGSEYEEYVEFSRGADLLVHDAEYRPEEYARKKAWGHSTFTDALELAMDAGARHLGLYHHNMERTDEDLDVMVGECEERVSKAGIQMKCSGITQESEFTF